MLNPYVLLGTLAVWVATAIGGFTFGVRYNEGREAVARQEAVDAAVSQLREDLKSQEVLAVQAAEKRAAKRKAASEVKHEIAILPARVECDWTADESRLLDDFYKAYFGADSAPGGVQGQVRQPSVPVKPSYQLGNGDVGVGLRLQKPAR